MDKHYTYRFDQDGMLRKTTCRRDHIAVDAYLDSNDDFSDIPDIWDVIEADSRVALAGRVVIHSIATPEPQSGALPGVMQEV